MDYLEKFILKNREQLDVWEVPQPVWARITRALDDDAWERFVREQRETFDAHEPAASVWEKLETELDRGEAEPLETAISDQREAMDDQETPEELWGKISDSLDADRQQDAEEQPSGKVVEMRVLWRYAAAVALLMGTLLTAQHLYLTQETPIPSSPEIAEVTDGEENNPLEELEQTEAYYTSLISEKKGQIRQYATDNPALYADFQQEVETLDSMYRELKIELYESQGSHRVMSALIENLQLRIDILNQQLNILEKIENYENDGDKNTGVEA